MRFALLGSGSAGNATLVARGADALLVDCGLSLRQLEARARALDFDLRQVRAILLTHEHDDHAAGAAALSVKYRIPIMASCGTLAALGDLPARAWGCEALLPERLESCAGFRPILVPHDAREPCQFVIGDGTHRLGILTDLGHVTPHVEAAMRELDALVLEFNHDPQRLATSAYPAPLRARIASAYGHLSNPQAAALLTAVAHPGLRRVVAAHLSEKTNTPAEVANVLGASVTTPWSIATQHTPSPWFVVDRAPRSDALRADISASLNCAS